jgi:hypothetical protein
MSNYRFAKRGNNGNAGHTGSKPSASKVTASSVAGVDRLNYGQDNNFVIIRQQLADKLREDYGDLSSFIDELRDKVLRAPNYVQASELSDPIALWAVIVATAGMHLDPGDGDDAGQSIGQNPVPN